MLSVVWHADGTERAYVRVIHRTEAGELCCPWRPNAMRMPDEFLDCACYLYRSEKDALSGTGGGGTGFNVYVEVEGYRALLMYIVTARHVIEQGYTTVRWNLADGTGTKPVDLGPGPWRFPDTGADVAVCGITGPWATLRGFVIPASEIITREEAYGHNIGVGDEIMMAGRLRYLEGRVINKPVARFGAIAMVPGEPIYNPDLDNEQVSFVVEMRSIGGYSGSPVFVYRDIPGQYVWGPKLLGVDWGHLFERTRSGAKENANMACVVPGWELLDLFYSDTVMKERVEMAERCGFDRLEDDDGIATDSVSRPGPEPERLYLEGTTEDVARRVLGAGKPDDAASED